MLNRMIAIYDKLRNLRTPGRTSIWEAGSDDLSARFAVAMRTAPAELLEAALAEYQQRQRDGRV